MIGGAGIEVKRVFFGVSEYKPRTIFLTRIIHEHCGLTHVLWLMKNAAQESVHNSENQNFIGLRTF